MVRIDKAESANIPAGESEAELWQACPQLATEEVAVTPP